MARREQLEQLLKEEPNDVFLNYALAKQQISDGEIAEGLAQFTRTLQLDPNYVPAFFQKAQVLAEQGNIAEAKENAQAGLIAAQKTGDAHAEGELNEFLQMLE